MNTSNEILHAYLQVSRHVSEKFRIYYGKLNLTYPQSIVLAILEADGPMPISALAEAAGSANSTISGVVDRLEKMDLAVDTLRNKYGEDSILRARFLKGELPHMAGGLAKERRTGVTKTV